MYFHVWMRTVCFFPWKYFGFGCVVYSHLEWNHTYPKNIKPKEVWFIGLEVKEVKK